MGRCSQPRKPWRITLSYTLHSNTPWNAHSAQESSPRPNILKSMSQGVLVTQREMSSPVNIVVVCSITANISVNIWGTNTSRSFLCGYRLHCDRLSMYCYRLLWSSMSRELVWSGAVLSCHILLCQFNVFYKLSHCLLSLSCMMSLQFFWSPPHTHIPEHSLHSHTATHLDTQTHTHHFHDTL